MLMIRQVPAMQGHYWMREAWRLFRQTPSVWMLLFTLFIFSQLILAAIPFLGNFLSTLIMPLLFAGLMQAASEPYPSPKCLLAGFYRNASPLITLGGTLMVAEFLCTVGAATLVGIDWRVFMGNGAMPPVEDLFSFMLYLMLLYSPFILASWLAPPLIYFRNVDAFTAMQGSLTAIWKNVPALTIYGLWTIAHLFLAGLTFGVTLLFSGPILVISTYLAYNDLFDKASKEGSHPVN